MTTQETIDRKNAEHYTFIEALAKTDIDKIMGPYVFYVDGDIPKGIKQFVRVIRKARKLTGIE